MTWQCWSMSVCLLLIAGCSERSMQADSIDTPLIQSPGDVMAGQEVFVSRDKGHCILCHQVDGLDAEFQGNVGPDLSLVGDRFTEGQLRLRIADYDALVRGVLMPSFYRTDGFSQVAAPYRRQTILTAQQVEDLVVYLGQLKDNEY